MFTREFCGCVRVRQNSFGVQFYSTNKMFVPIERFTLHILGITLIK